jgi:hypothetical protein
MSRATHIWLGEQQKAYSCGAASLKYALCILGFSPREDQLRKLARTTWRGTQTNAMVAAARKFGLVPKVRQFFEDEWTQARDWLHGELKAGRPVILDVDGFDHYVTAVQLFGGATAAGARVVVIDPEGGPLDGTAYARIVLCGEKRLRGWWLCGDEEGEPEAFRALSLQLPDVPPAAGPRPRGPRLHFSEKAVKRYVGGRPWILDEYLVDVVDMASGTAGAEGETVPLADMIRKVGRELVVERVAWWFEASPAEIQMIKAHVEDMAVAAEAMDLRVPTGGKNVVGADMAALLITMLNEGA